MKQRSVSFHGIYIRFGKFDSPGDTLSGEFDYYYTYPLRGNMRLYWVIDGIKVADNKKLNSILGEVKPGTIITLSYDGKNYTVS